LIFYLLKIEKHILLSILVLINVHLEFNRLLLVQIIFLKAQYQNVKGLSSSNTSPLGLKFSSLQ